MKEVDIMEYIGGKTRKYINPPIGSGESIERKCINAEPTITIPKAEYEEMLARVDSLAAENKQLKYNCAELTERIKSQRNDELTIVITNDGIKINSRAL